MRGVSNAPVASLARENVLGFSPLRWGPLPDPFDPNDPSPRDGCRLRNPHDSFAVPVIGRFDASDLGRDIVYLYQPGDGRDATLAALGGEISTVSNVAQQSAFVSPGGSLSRRRLPG